MLLLNTQAHVIVAVVGVHADQHGPLDLEGPLEDRRDLIGCADHEASRSECPCVLHRVHRSEGDFGLCTLGGNIPDALLSCSRYDEILPLGAIQSCHLNESGRDCQIQRSATVWRLRSEQQAVRYGLPVTWELQITPISRLIAASGEGHQSRLKRRP